MQDMQGSSVQTTSMLHKNLIDQVKARGHIVSSQVEAAFRAVPRHLFLPDLPYEEVYQDKAIATKLVNGHVVSSSSQPTIMAIMLEQLDLHQGQRVLEIGAGTGYNAALMAQIVGETGRVVTVDIDEDIVEQARKNLASAGFTHVQVVCADGGLGFPEAAPYDCIILTVNSGDITVAWHEQLAPEGRLLLPFSVRGPQIAVAFEQVGDHLESVSVRSCGFVGLRGAFAEQGLQLQLDAEPGLLYLTLGEQRPVDVQDVTRWLHTAPQEQVSARYVTTQELFSGLSLWLALHEPRFCSLTAQRSAIERGIVPNIFPMLANIPSYTTLGVLGDHALSVFVYAAQPAAKGSQKQDASLPLSIRTFGDDTEVVRTLNMLLTAWDAAGRPDERKLHISAYRNAPPPLPQGILIKKIATQFLFRWRD